MTLKELKKLVRSVVKECINEMLAEQFLRVVAEGKIASIQAQPKAPAPAPEPAPSPAPINESVSREELRARLREHVQDANIQEMYHDSLLNSPDPDEMPSNDVPEHVMEKMGVLTKDYSNYF